MKSIYSAFFSESSALNLSQRKTHGVKSRDLTDLTSILEQAQMKKLIKIFVQTNQDSMSSIASLALRLPAGIIFAAHGNDYGLWNHCRSYRNYYS